MDNSIIQSILKTEFKANVDGDVYTLNEKRKLTVIVQQGEGVMQVQHVLEVRFAKDFVALSSEKDVYYLDPSSLLGLKGANPELDKDDNRPGFRH